MPSKRKREGGEANVAHLEILFSVHAWLNSKVSLGSFNLINVTRTKSAFFSQTSNPNLSPFLKQLTQNST